MKPLRVRIVGGDDLDLILHLGDYIYESDWVTIALPGSYGKLRPALILQSDLFDEIRR
jgi:hypothetical protein